MLSFSVNNGAGRSFYCRKVLPAKQCAFRVVPVDQSKSLILRTTPARAEMPRLQGSVATRATSAAVGPMVDPAAAETALELANLHAALCGRSGVLGAPMSGDFQSGSTVGWTLSYHDLRRGGCRTNCAALELAACKWSKARTRFRSRTTPVIEWPTCSGNG